MAFSHEGYTRKRHGDAVTKKARPILLNCRPWAKKAPSFEGKILGKKLSCHFKKGGRKTLFTRKKIWGVSGT